MDLLSVLVLLYTVSGETHESEVHMPHAACMAAAPAISMAAGINAGPTIELLDGTRVPVTGATCIPACFADDPPGGLKLDIQAALRESDETEG